MPAQYVVKAGGVCASRWVAPAPSVIGTQKRLNNSPHPTPQYYNDIFLPVMGAYDPHRLLAGVAGEETRPPSAQRVVEQTPDRAGTGKAPPAARRRPLADISNRTPLRQLR